MKILSSLGGSTATLAGTTLLGWVIYDATNVQKTLGLEGRMEEAAVAVIGLSLAAMLMALGIYFLRRSRTPAVA